MTMLLMAIFGQVLRALSPKMARTEGASTTTPAMAPKRLPAIISHPVMNPR